MFGKSKQEIKALLKALLDDHNVTDIDTALDVLLEASLIHYRNTINATAHYPVRPENKKGKP